MNFDDLPGWLTVLLCMAVWIVYTATPSLAHTDSQLADWFAEWENRVIEQGHLDIGLVAEFNDMTSRHPCYLTPCVAPKTVSRTVTPPPPAPIEIESLLAQFFRPEDMGWALRVSRCESGWNPSAYNPSGASGLFQIMPYWWSGRSGYPAFDPFDPVENTRFAAWLFYTDGPSHWVCR